MPLNDKEKAAEQEYRDSTYEQIGALGGFLVPLIYLRRKKYAELHQWSTAALGGLIGFSFGAHIGITKNQFKAIESGDFQYPDGSVRRAIINNYCVWNNKNYQHELKRLKSFNKAYKNQSSSQSNPTERKTRSYADLREHIYKEQYHDAKKDSKENHKNYAENDHLENQFIYENEKPSDVPEFNQLLVPEIILHGESDFETFSGEKVTVRQVTDMYCDPVHQDPDKVDKVLEIEPRFQSYNDIRNSTVL